MLSATRRWFRRNRTPIAIGVGVVAGGVMVAKYAISKINDARERMSSDRIAKENLRRRFEQNQEDCTYTVLALLPTAAGNILQAMETERITLEIQQMKGNAAKSVKSGSGGSTSPPSIADTTMTEDDSRSAVSMQSESGIHASQTVLPTISETGDGTGPSPDGGQAAQAARKTKRQLWDDLAISAITRSFTLLYTVALLTMLTRVQLNLLGRRSYLSSVVSLATGAQHATINLENHDDDNAEEAYGSDFEVNKRYLTFSWWLLNRGWSDVMTRVEAAVKEVFGHLSPRDLVTYEKFSELKDRTRRLVEGGRPGDRWLPMLLPPADMEDFVLRESGVMDDAGTPSPAAAASLRRLLDETSDLVESPAFGHVLTLLLDAGFACLGKKLAYTAYELPPSDGVGSPELQQLQSGKAVLLPKILSVLTRQAHSIGNGMPNEYLQEMEQVRELEAFAAVVYSSNWETEIRDEGLGGESIIPPDEPRRSQMSGTTVEDSVVVVEPPGQISFESVWERAAAQK